MIKKQGKPELTGWPKTYTEWIENRTLHVSIPFTWTLPEVKARLMQRSIEWDSAIVGGPGAALIPDFFRGMPWVKVAWSDPTAMARVNPQATKTTTGCPNKCAFCAVPKIEGKLVELEDWPDRPIVMDNNLLAASQKHLGRVFDRLEKHPVVDFNQGVDHRLINGQVARRFARLKNPIIRLALDNAEGVRRWSSALETLVNAGVKKRSIRSYALVGFDSDPSEAWARCNGIENCGIMALPQWFHRLDSLEKNIVTKEQEALGWNDYERRRIMQWFYQHKKAVV